MGRPCYNYLFNRTEPCEICETFKTLKDNMPHTWEWTGPNKHIYSIYDFPYSDTGGSPLIMEMGIDVTELKEAQAKLITLNAGLEQKVRERTSELSKAIERLDILSQTSGKLLESENPEAIINSLCQRVMQFLDCQVFFNYLVDETSGILHLNSYAGIPEKTTQDIEWLESGVGVFGSVAKDGAGIVAEDIPGKSDPGIGNVKLFGIKAYASHPLLSHGKAIGTLSFGSISRNKFSEDDISLMKSVADQVATAITRIKNEESLRASEERYRRLMELSPSASIVTRNNRIVLLNSAARKLFGVNSADEILEKSPYDLFHPDYHDLIRERTEKVLSG
jgi:PAS domain-containing protein